MQSGLLPGHSRACPTALAYRSSPITRRHDSHRGLAPRAGTREEAQQTADRNYSSPSPGPSRPPPPPPPPPFFSPKSGSARRNLLAGLAIIPFGAAAYWLSQPIDDEDEDPKDFLPFDDGPQMADPQQIIFYDERGAWKYMEPQQGRDPVLIYNGKDLMVLDSAGDPLRLLPSASSADTVLLQGIRGEFYAIKPDVKQVDLRNPLQLVSYFANPRWEAALQRTKVALTTTQ